jgi:hypothetical protein
MAIMKTVTFLLVLSGLACTSEVPPPAEVEESLAPGPIRGVRLRGECPSGESCDERFAGASFSGSWDRAADEITLTAVGGTQRVSVAALEGGLDELMLTAEPIVLTSSDPTIFTVESTRMIDDRWLRSYIALAEPALFPQATVRFLREGEALLEVRTEDGLLVDRIAMQGRLAAGVTATLGAPGSTAAENLIVSGFDAGGELVIDRDFTVSARIALTHSASQYNALAGDRVDSLEGETVTVVFGGRDFEVTVTR